MIDILGEYFEQDDQKDQKKLDGKISQYSQDLAGTLGEFKTVANGGVLLIPATPKTPEVHFDKFSNEFRISGRSIPENGPQFYQTIVDRINEYAKNPNPQSTFVFELEYFNTTSSKCLLDIFRKLEKIEGVKIDWKYDEGDEDSDFVECYGPGGLLGVKFNLVVS